MAWMHRCKLFFAYKSVEESNQNPPCIGLLTQMGANAEGVALSRVDSDQPQGRHVDHASTCSEVGPEFRATP